MDIQENDTQYRFTAYLMKSIANYKPKYKRKKELLLEFETLFGSFNEFSSEWMDSYTDEELFAIGLKNTALENALKKVKTRDVHILLLHLLEEHSLKEIASLLDIKYNTVLSIYARTLKKIKNDMEGDDHEF